MKISNSKRELAKIISENGGWRDDVYETAFAVQSGEGGHISFCHYKPYRLDGKVRWTCPDGFSGQINAVKLKNWHQAVLSSAEYFHLYPAPDADGWIEWKGGKCPVEAGALIDVKYRDLHVQLGSKVGDRSAVEMHATTHWRNSGGAADIIAYRLHKPEQAKSTAVGDDETNLAAKEELEAMELSESAEVRANLAKIYAPSIESLAADYRNKLEYAERKQDEADKAKIESDTALSELEKAIAAIGFAITPIGAVAQEPELVIANRGQLEIDDVIWLSECRPKNDMPEGEYRVVKVGTIGVEFNSSITYPDFSRRSWRFIRRPAK